MSTLFNQEHQIKEEQEQERDHENEKGQNSDKDKQQTQISDKAMRHLFSLNYSIKESYNVNLILQIVHIAKCDDPPTQNTTKQIYTATLGDMTHKYNGFVFIKEKEAINLQESFLITILQVSPIICANQPSRVFVVKKYESLDTQFPINDTFLIKDNKGVAIFEPEPIDEGKLILVKDQLNKINYYTPLKKLTSFSKDFRIFVGVISKSEKKFYNSSQGYPGSLFSFIVIDEQGSEMEVTCFNQLVNKFYDKIKVNCTYEIIDGSVRRAQKNYNAYLNTDYKIVLEPNSSVTEKEDIEKSINLPSNNNTPIEDIPSLPLYSLINTIGMVIEEGEHIMKKTKSGERPMRIISIADASGFKIELTLWGNFASQPLIKGQVLQLKCVKIGDFNGRNISTVNESHIAVNPNTKDANELPASIVSFNGVFKDLGSEYNSKNVMKEMNDLGLLNSSSQPSSSSMRKIEFMHEVLDSIDEVVETSNLTRIKGTITRMTHNDRNFYPGCPERSCKKKLTQNFNEWICLVCNKKYLKPTFYFTLSLRIKDCSCEHWIDIFGKTAESLLKLTAEEYKNELYDKESTRLKEISSELEFKDYIFIIKSKIQMFNSIPKKKLQVYKIDPVNQREDARRLIADIKFSLKQ